MIVTDPDQGTLDALLEFIASEFNDGAPVTPTQQLMPDLVDSLGVFVLTEFIQAKLGVVIDDFDLSGENLATTRALSILINNLRNEATRAATVNPDTKGPPP
jgi:acyl carrier protein